MHNFNRRWIQKKLWGTGLVLVTVLTLACAQPDRPNILFLLADDLRPDCISALGNENIETPHFDRLVEEGLSFSKATCSSPICLISRAEMITGNHTWQNDLYQFSVAGPVNDSLDYWPETFAKAGYETWEVGKWHVRGRPSDVGYTKVSGLFAGGGGRSHNTESVDWKGMPITGYSKWVFQSDDGKTRYPEAGVGLTPLTDQHIADSAISLINGKGEKPWMGHVNFTSPHDPLFNLPGWEELNEIREIETPENFMPRHPFDHGNLKGRDEALLAWPRTEAMVQDLRRVYYSVVENLDRQVGRILEHLEKTGELDHTIVIFSSDHGIGIGSHGLRGKQNQYEHTINVPLIFRGPDIRRGARTDAQVYLRELFPTTCDLVGIDIPASVTSRSFKKVIDGSDHAHHSFIFGYYSDSQRMVRSSDGWKLIFYPRINYWQLFDLNEDALELHNLMGSGESFHQNKYQELKHQLDTWRETYQDPLLIN